MHKVLSLPTHTHTDTQSCAPCCYLSSCLCASPLWLVSRSSVFWSVTMQMMIIRERRSHLITDIMNWVPLSMCVRVCLCLRASKFVCSYLGSGVLLKLDAEAVSSCSVPLIAFEWPVMADVISSFEWCVRLCCVVEKETQREDFLILSLLFFKCFFLFNWNGRNRSMYMLPLTHCLIWFNELYWCDIRLTLDTCSDGRILTHPPH